MIFSRNKIGSLHFFCVLFFEEQNSPTINKKKEIKMSQIDTNGPSCQLALFGGDAVEEHHSGLLG